MLGARRGDRGDARGMDRRAARPAGRAVERAGGRRRPAARRVASRGRRAARGVAEHVPPAHRRAVAEFFDSPPPERGHDLVFSHNDLGIEHVLVDPAGWTVTGVIDWSDAALVDPAYDFGLLHRDLGPVALRAALGRYPAGAEALAERAVFYARCSVFEDLAYGVDTGRAGYLDRGVAAMAWLFP
ncbi:phosphotransferase [Catellatospora coxensis]